MCNFSNLFCSNRRSGRTCGCQRTRVVDAGGRNSCVCDCPCYGYRDC